ncbi:choice-of-anchor B family protein [Marivirga salinae]|uniref:Choice-of-anchor B family protein n=1 Tax=Marivirga salinarum TaxID=3059078 RepID=A0AA49J8L2_9BACT|nr:choice-of-anchor B family protein [Marivirga sp. BDSF4-3]WKK75394.2 choice-of-anchor B family protein [Marivirga sp. BDSF4-3]
MTKIFTLFAVLISVNLIAQTPCENGEVDGYPCNQVDFYANLNNSALSGTSGVGSNDIWGWTDPETNTEYVIIGQDNGTVFVDISNPSSPVVIGRLPSHTGNSSSWRDIKVYDNHAFIVADNNSGHGMQVFDLTRLRDAGSSIVTFDNDAHYDGVSSAHNVVINEETGFAYIVGARGAGNECGQGGLHIVNIQDPKNPVFTGCFDADGYTHDAQCVIYNGPDSDYQGQEICFNANENTVTIANVDDKNNTSLIAKEGYPQSAYSHQGWLTEDHKYFISGDELDEGNSVYRTRTLVWDVRDLDNPVLLTQYYSERVAIDHNLYTKDDMVFQSNYTNGLVILDSKKVENGNLREIAFFDTFPQGNNTGFNGSWSNYPFFESGIIAVSDISNGLFLLQPNIKDIITEHPNFTECGSGQKVINVSVDAQYEVDNFQWQIITENIPSDLQEGDNFSGINTSELTINSITEDIVNSKFRCKVQLSTGEIAYSYPSSQPSGLPEPSFTFNRSGDLTVSFTNKSINADSVVWDFGDGSDFSNEENPVHIYNELKEYTVTLTGFNFCGEQTISENLGASVLNNRQELGKDVNIYPNPVKDILKIKQSENSNLLSFRVLNISGHTVYESGKQSAIIADNINTAEWKSGMYLVLLTFEDGGRIVKKIIKE